MNCVEPAAAAAAAAAQQFVAFQKDHLQIQCEDGRARIARFQRDAKERHRELDPVE